MNKNYRISKTLVEQLSFEELKDALRWRFSRFGMVDSILWHREDVVKNSNGNFWKEILMIWRKNGQSNSTLSKWRNYCLSMQMDFTEALAIC